MDLQEQISDINDKIKDLPTALDKAAFVNLFIVDNEQYSREAITSVVADLCKENAIITIPKNQDNATAFGINTHFFNEETDYAALARAKQLALDVHQDLASVSRVIYKNRELNGGRVKG